MLALGAGAGAAVKDGSDFYTPPANMPKKAPGTLIRSTPITAPSGAKAWKVLYHSRSVDGRDIAVSGVVVVPTERRAEGRPPGGDVGARHHGTRRPVRAVEGSRRRRARCRT